MIGMHFQKKFSKRPPPGIIVTEVIKNEFSEKIESYGTAVSKKTETFRIKKNQLLSELDLKDYVRKGDLIVKLNDGNIIAPFDGALGYRGLTEDVLGTDKVTSLSLAAAVAKPNVTPAPALEDENSVSKFKMPAKVAEPVLYPPVSANAIPAVSTEMLPDDCVNDEYENSPAP